MAFPTECDSLDQLQTPEQVELLDAVDKLRSQGLGHYNISLPQLIVCGDQSSGKSSLLEGLTRLRFPAREGLCTTFATELVLRKQNEVEIVCTIVAGKDRSQAERRELAKFSRRFSSRDEFSFPTLIDEANEQMSVGTKSNRGPFFEDILRIRYCGPDLPSLTVVDLPGIISSQVGGGNGVQKVLQLVEGYMRDEKSIILAVVAANYDREIQKIFTYIQEFDKNATRTLGIITKPDDVRSTAGEEKVLQVARNEYCPLKLRWHVVKNRSPNELEFSDAERDESERLFFEKGVWASLPRSDVGIGALRTRLSRVLLEHIVQELPSLMATIHDAVTTTEASFRALGKPRENTQQQRDYLIEKAEKFQILTYNALRGIYSNPFFKLRSTARLRTEIQNLNIAFARTMYRKGHTWDIVNDGSQSGDLDVNAGVLSSEAVDDYDAFFEEPANIQRTSFLQDHIGNYVQHSRQSGLPSIVNPWVISEVFRQQSDRWAAIALHHLEQVFEAVKDYIELGLNSLMDSRTRNLLMLEQIEEDLEQRWVDVKAKLHELLLPYTEQDPVTYDPTFINEINAIRAKRYASQQKGSTLGKPAGGQLLMESMDDFTNSEILDLMQTYYKKAISVFINNVAVLAIENCLIVKLESIFSPVLVSGMQDEKLGAIAAESEETRSERAALKQKLDDLKYGKRVLHVHACDTRTSIKASPRSQRPTSRPRRNEAAPSYPQTPPLTSQTSQSIHSQSEIGEMTSHFNNLTVTPPQSSPNPQQRLNSRSRSVTPSPTPQKKEAGRRRGWPPSFQTVETDSEDEMHERMGSERIMTEVTAY